MDHLSIPGIQFSHMIGQALANLVNSPGECEQQIFQERRKTEYVPDAGCALAYLCCSFRAGRTFRLPLTKRGVLLLDKDQYYLGDNTVFKRTLHNTYMFLDPRDGVNFGIMFFGQWEEWLTRQFVTAVKPGMTVLDIGAHSGYFSLIAGTRVGPTGTVHAFEPLPFHHKNFLKSVSVNGCAGRVHLHRVMLSNKSGETEIRTRGEGGAVYTFHGLDEISETTTVYKVPKVVLTDYLPNLRADVIKIDVDDSAPIVMDSVYKVIDNSGPMTIFMEYQPVFWEGHDRLAALHGLQQRGFRFHILHHDGRVEPTTPQALALYNGVQWLDLMVVR